MNTFKPEALYKKSNLDGMEIIPFQTAVVGTAVKFDSIRREVIVDLGYGTIGIIPEDEVTVYEFTYPEGKKTPRQISGIIGTQVRAIVTETVNKNCLKLSRKMSMIQAWEALQENTNVMAYVFKIIDCGVFLDIGNGIITYSNRKESTTVLISDARIWYNTGEIVNVRILDKGDNASQNIVCSIKAAYPSLAEADVSVGDIITVRIGMVKVDGGYFCESNHNVQGIIDTTLDLQEGQTVKGVVKKITEKGLKIKHLE